MADINARTRLLVGSTDEWAFSSGLVLGDGELVLERAGGRVKVKAGDGASPYSALPFISAEPMIPAEYLTQAEGDVRYLPLIDVVATASANKVPRMGAQGLLARSMIPLPPLVATSAGPADAGKMVALSTNGKIHPTMVVTTVTTGGYKGPINATVQWPEGTYKPGDYYINQVGGLVHSSWGMVPGTMISVGNMLVFNGAGWDIVGTTGEAYVPIAGGTMTGGLRIDSGTQPSLIANSASVDGGWNTAVLIPSDSGGQGYIGQVPLGQGGVQMVAGAHYKAGGLYVADGAAIGFAGIQALGPELRFFAQGVAGSAEFTPAERMRLDSSGNLLLDGGRLVVDAPFVHGGVNAAFVVVGDSSVNGYVAQVPTQGGIQVLSGGHYYGGGLYIADAAAVGFAGMQAIGSTLQFFAQGVAGSAQFDPVVRFEVIGDGRLIYTPPDDGFPLEVGFRQLRRLPSITTANALAARSMAGKMQPLDVGASNFTITAGIFEIGDTLHIVNFTASPITIVANPDPLLTMHYGALTGNRTLGPYGVCSIWFASNGECFVVGTGVS